MSRRSKRVREDAEDDDEDVDREVAAAVAAAVAEALPPPILENGNVTIDVEEQASKLKEKRLFDIIDYEQEVILKLEGTEKQMRAPHFKIMSVSSLSRLDLTKIAQTLIFLHCLIRTLLTFTPKITNCSITVACTFEMKCVISLLWLQLSTWRNSQVKISINSSEALPSCATSACEKTTMPLAWINPIGR